MLSLLFHAIHNDEHHVALDVVLVAAIKLTLLYVVLSHTPQVWKMHCKNRIFKSNSKWSGEWSIPFSFHTLAGQPVYVA